MTKSNRTFFVSCCLITDGCAIINSYICTITCCERIVSGCRTTSNTNRSESSHKTIGSPNSYR